MPDDIDENEDHWDNDVQEMPDDFPCSYVQDWWTWNMALVWITFRSQAIVDRIGVEQDDALAVGQFLLSELETGNTEFDDQIGTAWANDQDEPHGTASLDEAQLELLKAVWSGKVRVTGTSGDGQGKPVTVPTSELAFLDYRPSGPGQEGVLSRFATDVAPRASENPANLPHLPLLYRQPRLRRGDIVKLFEPHGKRVGSNRQVEVSIVWLAEYLKEADGTPIKDDCRVKVREAGFEITDNQYNARVWPEAVSQSGRPELRDPGRRSEDDGKR